MPLDVLDLDAGFRKVENNADVVRRLLPTIEHYRSKGKTLRTIHRVLFEADELAMAFSSFKNSYYAQRKIKQSSNKPALDSSKPYALPTSSMNKKLIEDVKTKENDSASATKKTRTIAVEGQSYEEYLAAHQAQATAYFESR